MTYAVTTRRDIVRPVGGSGAELKEVWPTDAQFIRLVYTGMIDGQVGGSAPVSTSKLWLDTSGGLSAPAVWKYHNGSAWVTTAGTIAVAAHITARGGIPAADKGDVVVLSNGSWELDPVASAARIAASATAMDSISDALQFDELTSPQVTNLKTSLSLTAGQPFTLLPTTAVTGTVDSVTLDIPVGSNGGSICQVLTSHLVCAGSNFTIEFSLDGGTNWASPTGWTAWTAATTYTMSFELIVPPTSTGTSLLASGYYRNEGSGAATSILINTAGSITNSGVSRKMRIKANTGGNLLAWGALGIGRLI